MAKKLTKILQYPAVFEANEQGGYNVSFPDFPGCVTFGRNFEDAKSKAREVLELWLEELNANGEDIPVHQSFPIVDQINVFAPRVRHTKTNYASSQRQKAH